MVENRPSIIEVVSRYVALKRSGKGFRGLCPFHAEKTPSFTVSEDKARFYCFGCQAKGDVISFIEKIEGLSFREAVSHLGIQKIFRPKPVDTRKKHAAMLLAHWMNREHLKVGAMLREFSQQIAIAEQIPDAELTESLIREWEILSDLHDDLQSAQHVTELWEVRHSIEAITARANPEPLPEFPELTPEYRQYLAAAVKGELC